jgi:amino acid transporter
MAHMAGENQDRFGTFRGVFRPTVLTILGAMIYLREGYVVGELGLVGFLLLLVAIYVVTTTTAISLSSVTTNVRIGDGGVFSLISQSMGLEAGGAIGIPLYLAVSFGAAMYAYAFSEGWCAIFPDHPSWIVASGCLAAAILTAWASAKMAFRVQTIVLIGTLIALISAVLGLHNLTEPVELELWTSPGANWVDMFALFFPAATGITVGAAMSGSLAAPKRSIPRGTLAAVAVSFTLYAGFAFWYAAVGTSETLRQNYTIMVDAAAWGPGILIGLMASTFTATVSSVIAAPRVLHALAQFNVLPGSSYLVAGAKNGEPRRALAVTGVIAGLALMSGSLDAIAPLLTVFFLITYASINLVLLIEQSLDLTSFRPTFRVPLAVPLVGSAACLLAILVVSPVVGVIALILVAVVYGWLVRRKLATPYESVRSGLFVNFAGWAARRVTGLATSVRSWKPDLMVPVEATTELLGSYRLLHGLTYPKGSIKVIGVGERGSGPLAGLESITEDFHADGIYATCSRVPLAQYDAGATVSLAVLEGAFFPPNIVFVHGDGKSNESLQRVMEAARHANAGMVIYLPHPEAALGRQRTVNLFIRDQSPDWRLSLHMASLDLTTLLALQLHENWTARLSLLCAVDDKDVSNARNFLKEFADEARIPGETDHQVMVGSLQDALVECEPADINILGMPPEVDLDWMREVTLAVRGSCLFVLASGQESALA